MAGPAGFEGEARLIRALYNASNVFQRVATRLVYGPAGLSTPQYLLLLLLRESSEPLTLTELAARAYLIKQAMTPAFQRLQAKGLVTEVPDTSDRRVCRVTLTEKGRALLEQVEPARRELYRQLLGEAAPDAKSSATDVLTQLLGAAARLERLQSAPLHPQGGTS
ncbi:MAG TPA: MarR family transcriptional regulator [Chloroflexota bacterium]|nr:MarR family transcriptional regulator [Chloroflexota bacterium]